MLKIALTGNIASGKSEVEKILIELGFKTLCLDSAVHNIYDFDTEIQKKLKQIFNTIKRSEIAKVVFKDKKKLNMLEDILYPKLKEILNDFFNKNSNLNGVFVIAPMLFEAGFDRFFDKIIFVYCPDDIRLERLIKRNNLTKEEALLRMNSQENQNLKIKKSDVVINNGGSKDNLIIETNKAIKELGIL